ncbi:MAG TPA: BrnA antitoxin family protein [Treponema sp.]|nr:BrnA antitoxin family protein [Treponema sp.]
MPHYLFCLLLLLCKPLRWNGLYKPRKEQITVRIDSDVLVWLKSFGKGYQTLMNELLKNQAEAHKRPERALAMLTAVRRRRYGISPRLKGIPR